jgi:hypothetical protein
VASITVISDRSEIPSSGASDATITALVKDNSNNAVSGETVRFSASAGILEVTQSETDGSGQAIALLSTGGDKQNRVITVTVTVGSFTDTVNVAVAGTRLTLNGPSAMVRNDTAAFEALLEDSSGGGISNQDVTISSDAGNTLSSSILTTDANGRVAFTMRADRSGADTVRASALGLQAAQPVSVSDDTFVFQTPTNNQEIPLNTSEAVSVLWQKSGVNQNGETINFSRTRGELSQSSAVTSSGTASVTISSANAGLAIISASVAGGPSTQVQVEFVATDPDALSVQAEPLSLAPSSSSTVTAVLRDPKGNLVKNEDIEFSLTDTSGGQISQGLVKTDSQGRAQTTYTASVNTSGQNQVRIDARVVSEPTVASFVELTVADRPLHITIGTGNEVNVISGVGYGKPYLLLVNDADGNPVSDVDVQLSITSLEYATGCWVKEAAEGDEQTLTCDGVNSGSQGGTVKGWVQVLVDVCPSEDANNNGELEPPEDFNNNDKLDPGRPAAVQGSVTTGEDGTAEFTVNYPKDRSNWVAVRLVAKREVVGTESFATSDFVLPVVESEVTNDVPPPGNPSPYGIADYGCP